MKRVSAFPKDAKPIRQPRRLMDPKVIEAVEMELFDSAYPGDNGMRRALALDIVAAIEKARQD